MIRLINAMGTDLTVANAARVSFHKQGEWETTSAFATEVVAKEARADDPRARPGSDFCYELGAGGWIYERLSEKDAKLIYSLARDGHWSPFSHALVQFRIKMPLALARQWYKHRIGIEKDCGWNEVSRRYVDEEPEFFMPTGWRKRPTGNRKQGSSDEVVEKIFGDRLINSLVSAHFESARRLYAEMIEQGVAPELARLVLPNATMTEWIETGSIAAYARLIQLRLDAHAQKDIQPYASAVFQSINAMFPTSWAALMGSKL